MAELNIKITTKYDQAQQGFEKVTKSVKAYRKELIEARASGENVAAAENDYILALNKALQQTDYMKEGTAALKSQMKILKTEVFELNSAFGSSDEIVKSVNGALEDTQKASGGTTTALKKVTANMKDVDKASGGATTKLLSVAKNILKFQLLMGPITGAIRGFKNTISDFMKVAAEAEQTFSKLRTVFAGVGDSAASMAKSLAGSIGVASSTAAGALSTVGDLLQAQGMGTSESLNVAGEWVSKFQDIIAFKDINMSLEEFAQNFMSGAAGNLRNFRTFGSIVKESAVQARLASEGLDQLTGSELELAKMTTRATIALEQQENAMGATQREWDTMLSVNRRLNEAWKEYKENLGETLNRILKPAKTWLTDILDYTNDVTRALKEIEGGEFTVKVEQATTEDFLSVVSRVLMSMTQEMVVPDNMSFWDRLVEATALSGGATVQQVYASHALTAEQLRDVMLATGANRDQLMQAAIGSGVNITPQLLGEAEALVIAFKDAADAAARYAKETETEAGNLDNFLEALMGIKGVGTGLSAGELMLGSDSFENQIKEAISQASEDALNNIRSTKLSGFVSAIDLALGEVDETDMLKGKANSLRTLYTTLFNQFTKDKTLQQNAGILKSVLSQYQQTLAEEQRIIAGREKAATFKSGLTSMRGTTSGYAREMSLVGLSELDAQIAQITFSFDDLKAQFAGMTDDELKEFGIDLALLDEELQNQIQAYTNLYNKQKDYETLIAAQTDARNILSRFQGNQADAAAIAGYVGKRLDVNGTIAADSMNESQAEYYNSWRKEAAVIQDDLKKITYTLNAAGEKVYDFGDGLLLTGNEINEIMDNELIRNMKDLAEVVKDTAAEWRRNLWNSINPAANYIDAYKQGQENFDFKGGGLVALLIELLKNTETFKTVMSIVTDTIVPILDGILKPLLPVLRVLQQFLDNLPWDIIFEIFRAVSVVVVAALDVITRILGTISAVVKTIYYAVTLQWGKISGVWEDFIADQRNITSRTEDALDELVDMTFKIERNTEKDDLKTLNELLARGIINEKQYNAGARVLQKDMIFDPVIPSYPSYAATAPTMTTVSYGGITIVINGNDPAEIERTLNRYFEKQGISYNEPLALGGY